MAKKKRDTAAHGTRYTEESKKRGAKMLEEEGATVKAVAKSLGIPPRTLRRWATQHGVACPGNEREYDRTLIRRELRKKNSTLASVAAKVGCSERLVGTVRSEAQ